MQRIEKDGNQKGFVSIITVLFFIVLVTVITVGFTRLMILEQRQSLEDQLTKSAYNSALSGVEDAKRAMLYCASLPLGASRDACYNALYSPSCPGFNATPLFSAAIGIPQSGAGGKTPLLGATASSSELGYSCVLVKRNLKSIYGTLSSGGQGQLHELRTLAATPYSTIRVSWHKPSGLSSYYPQGTFLVGSGSNPGNLRSADWASASPAAIRLMLMAVPETVPYGEADILQYSTFVYPVGVMGSTPDINVGLDPLSPVAPSSKRYEAQCTAASLTDYKCSIDIVISSTARNKGVYLMLNALYKDTSYQIQVLPSSLGSPIEFDGVQQAIDSTGYTGGVYRRVQALVRPGGPMLATPNALESGLGLCKDFRVGVDAGTFLNNAACN